MSQMPPITFDVAIIGGGPGGLMTAMHVNKKVGAEAKITIFEASPRLGGKLMTGTFAKTGAQYEIGVAEIYDYAHLGFDPLKDLITNTLGLPVKKMDSECVIVDDKIMNTVDDIERLCGKKTRDAVVNFRKKCASMMTPDQYFEGTGRDDNDHPWMFKSGLDVLHDEIKDDMARRYMRINAHSDIAIGPNETSGLNALKNFLMDYDEYIQYYCVEGGNERIIGKLAEIVQADIQLRNRVRRIGKTKDGRYRLTIVGPDNAEYTREFDFVVISLPFNWLQTIEWEGEALSRAMARHLDHFNVPAHYLRVAIAFKERFWDKHVQGSWWMSDQFNGHCVYIESTRYDYENGTGGLNWLIAGSDAQALANLPDDHLVRFALDSLPPQMREEAKGLVIETKVHRWLNTVNGIPGGRPVHDTQANHMPEPKEHPGLFVTGDYLFDATVNGVLDSADCASDMLMSVYVKRNYEERLRQRVKGKEKQDKLIRSSRNINRDYFNNYWNVGPYKDVWQQFFNAEFLRDSIRSVFGEGGTFSILDAGSASGQTVGALRALGLNAHGVEKNAWIHAQTAPELKKFNHLGDVTDLPFKDGQFDYIYETCLANLPPSKVQAAIHELHRVAKKGVILGSVTSDLAWEALISRDAERGIKTFGTLWQWSDWFFNVGFEHATEDMGVLEPLYEKATAAGLGKGQWFEDADSLQFVFFRRLDV